MSIGNNIYKLRTSKNLSQGELADLLDVSRQSVSKWETDAQNSRLVARSLKTLDFSRVFSVFWAKFQEEEKRHGFKSFFEPKKLGLAT